MWVGAHDGRMREETKRATQTKKEERKSRVGRHPTDTGRKMACHRPPSPAALPSPLPPPPLPLRIRLRLEVHSLPCLQVLHDASVLLLKGSHTLPLLLQLDGCPSGLEAGAAETKPSRGPSCGATKREWRRRGTTPPQRGDVGADIGWVACRHGAV